MFPILIVLGIGIASAVVDIARVRDRATGVAWIAWRLTAGVGGASAAAVLASALQGYQDASLAVVACAVAGAGLCLTTLEIFGATGAATFLAGIVLAGVGGAHVLTLLSSVALSATVLR